MNIVFTTCILGASINVELYQLSPATLNTKLCILNFLPVDRNSLAFNKMVVSDRTAHLEEEHDEQPEDQIAKTKKLFNDDHFSSQSIL